MQWKESVTIITYNIDVKNIIKIRKTRIEILELRQPLKLIFIPSMYNNAYF